MTTQQTMAAPTTEEIDYKELAAWALSGDTGTSSCAMAACLGGVPSPDRERFYNYPHDLDDFGRCYRLLERIPALRVHLEKMRELGPVWNALVDAWSQIETAYVNYVKVCLEQAEANKTRDAELMAQVTAGTLTLDEAQAIWSAQAAEWQKTREQAWRGAYRLLKAALHTGNPARERSVEDVEESWAHWDRKAAEEAAKATTQANRSASGDDDNDDDEWDDDDDDDDEWDDQWEDDDDSEEEID